MLGFATLTEALVWVQTDAPAEVVIEYWPEGEAEEVARTEAVLTVSRDACVAKVMVTGLAMNTVYDYRILVDGEAQTVHYREGFREGATIPLKLRPKPAWRFREEGHAIFDFRFAAGSCAYYNEPGGYDRLNSRPYGAEFEIFEAIHEMEPEVFLWLGDNWYYTEADFESRTGMLHRASYQRAMPEMRGLLAGTMQLAIWDDHDYGPNNAGWPYHLKPEAQEVFSLFWGNPSAGLPELPGVFTTYNYGDVNMVFLDNRSYRSPDGRGKPVYTGPKAHFGLRQVDWAVDTLIWMHSQSRGSYRANFNLVLAGSQVLSSNPYYEGFNAYAEEKAYLIERLRKSGVPNVIFVTGDIHASEFSRQAWPAVAGGQYVLYDVTSSSLTSGTWQGNSPNEQRIPVPGTKDGMIRVRNFVTLDFKGPLDERRCEVRYWNSRGELLSGDPETGEITEEFIIRAE